MLRKVLLVCGILAALLYAGMNVFVPMLYEGYSYSYHTVSELSAIGAPTRSLWVGLGIVYTLLYAAFGCGVWLSADNNRPLRIAGGLMLIHGIVGLFWPPMHQREVLAAGGKTLTDTMHIVFTVVTVLLFMLAIGFAAAAFRKRFRLYSIVTIVILFVGGFLAGLDGPNVEANLPTPWVGFWERVNIAAFLIWLMVLAVMLLRVELNRRPVRHEKGRLMPIRDVSLFVRLMGDGDPLLLMHGGPGLDHTTLLTLEPLADQFTLILYDHRCNGRSTGDVESMTWDNLTADADALREALGFEKWAVLGHSFGGNVALEYALRYPERLSRLVLMGTAADNWWVEHNAPRLLLKRGYSAATVRAAHRFYNGQLKPKEVLPIVLRFVRAYYDHFSLLSAPHEVVSAFRLKMRPEAHVFGFKNLLAGWTVMDRLKEIEVPTLVLAGRQDFLYPPEHQAILADRLPHAELEIIERAGHNPQEEQNAEVIKILRRFVAGEPFD